MNKEKIKEKLKSSEYDFLRTDEKLKDNIVLLVVAGSHAYGLNTEESDLDIRGISMGTPDSILGMESFDVFEDRKTDTVIYSMKRFMELAMKGAPSVLEILFSNPENILYCDEKIGKMLLDNRDMFLSKRIYYSFKGYAKNALKDAEKRLETNPKKADKYAMHYIRLCLEVEEMLRTGSFNDVLDRNRNMLMWIRNGSMRHGNKFTEEFYESVRDFENLLEKAYQNSLLPDTVDVKKVSRLLVKMNKEFLKGEICCD